MLDKYKVLKSAEYYVLRGKYPQAIHEYQKFIKQEGDDPSVLNTLGDLQLRTGRVDEALACFHKVASQYVNAGFAAKAIAMFKKIHHINPHDLEVNQNLVELYRKQGLIQDAARHLEGMAERCQSWGQIEEALNYVDLLLPLNVANPHVQLRAARLRKQLGQVESSLTHYTESARQFLKEGAGERAFQTAFEGVRAGTEYAPLVSVFMEAAQQAGREEEAQTFLQSQGTPRPEAPAVPAGEPLRFEMTTGESGIEALSQFEPPDTRTEERPRRPEPSLDLSLDLFTSSSAEPSAARESAEPASGEPPARVESLEEALQEADFYLKLGLTEDARRLIFELARQFPGDERVLRRAERAMIQLPQIEMISAEAGPNGAEVEHGSFEFEVETALEGLFSGSFDEAPDEILRYDVVANSGDEDASDPKVHYDLGLAYKDMGLTDDAIQEFKTAFDLMDGTEHNPQRILCCSMLANAYLHQARYDEAVRWADQGLKLPDKKEFEWKALQYDLASALEQQGRRDEALEGYQRIAQMDPEYRDVNHRVSALSVPAHGQ